MRIPVGLSAFDNMPDIQSNHISIVAARIRMEINVSVL